MTAIDPRKSESITNQANYLLTATTTMLIASLTASISTHQWDLVQYGVLAMFWIIGASYREIRKVIDSWTKKQQFSDS